MPRGVKFTEDHWKNKSEKFISLCSAKPQPVKELNSKFTVHEVRVLRQRYARKLETRRIGIDTCLVVKGSDAAKEKKPTKAKSVRGRSTKAKAKSKKAG